MNEIETMNGKCVFGWLSYFVHNPCDTISDCVCIIMNITVHNSSPKVQYSNMFLSNHTVVSLRTGICAKLLYRPD